MIDFTAEAELTANIAEAQRLMSENLTAMRALRLCLRSRRASQLPGQELSPEQLAAIRVYAVENGRTWKSQLNDDWMNGRTSGPLQQVRNQFGPSWLVRFRLPKEKS